MSRKPIRPRLADRFCLLAVSQIQTQVSRSGALDAGALGMMAVDIAIAAIVVDSGTHGLWIAALTLLGLSLCVAARTLLTPGAEQNGPSVAEMLNARASNEDETIEEGLLKNLAEDVQINEQSLAHKDSMTAWAVAPLLLAITIELAGRLC
jgi:hypothetical protein